MALADTAQLLVNLVVKSNASTVLGKDKGRSVISARRC
jgi:hypothetical protein